MILEVAFTEIGDRQAIEDLGFEWKHPKGCTSPKCEIEYPHVHDANMSVMVTEVEDEYDILEQEI